MNKKTIHLSSIGGNIGSLICIALFASIIGVIISLSEVLTTREILIIVFCVFMLWFCIVCLFNRIVVDKTKGKVLIYSFFCRTIKISDIYDIKANIQHGSNTGSSIIFILKNEKKIRTGGYIAPFNSNPEKTNEIVELLKKYIA